MTDLSLTERSTPALFRMADQARREVNFLESDDCAYLNPVKKAAIAHHQAVKWGAQRELRRRGALPVDRLPE